MEGKGKSWRSSKLTGRWLGSAGEALRKAHQTSHLAVCSDGAIKEQGGWLADDGVVPEAWVEPCEFCRLRSKYGSVDPFDARLLRPLEEENAKLRPLTADVIPNSVVVNDLTGKPRSRRYNGGTWCCWECRTV